MGFVNCSSVNVIRGYRGFQAIASRNILINRQIEKGVITWIYPTDSLDYETRIYDPNLFYWKHKQGYLSGCANEYIKSPTPNSIIFPDYKKNTYVVRALRDIKLGESLSLPCICPEEASKQFIVGDICEN